MSAMLTPVTPAMAANQETKIYQLTTAGWVESAGKGLNWSSGGVPYPWYDFVDRHEDGSYTDSTTDESASGQINDHIGVNCISFSTNKLFNVTAAIACMDANGYVWADGESATENTSALVSDAAMFVTDLTEDSSDNMYVKARPRTQAELGGSTISQSPSTGHVDSDRTPLYAFAGVILAAGVGLLARRRLA